MKPHQGDWKGIFVPQGSGNGIPITVRLSKVNEDGSLRGSFVITQDLRGQDLPAEGPSDPPVGSYSPFGTLHLEQEIVDTAHSFTGKLKIDGRFEVPNSHTGLIWGTVLITGKQPVSGTQTEGTKTTAVSGTIAAVWAGTDQSVQKIWS